METEHGGDYEHAENNDAWNRGRSFFTRIYQPICTKNMKTKEFLCALSDRMRFYTLTALQVFLGITILPALAVVVAILWIDEVKD